MSPTTGTFLPPLKTSDVDGIVRALQDDGAAFMPGAISPELAARACKKIDELEHQEGDDHGARGLLDHYKCVFNRDPFWLQFIDPPGLIDAVEKLMGSQCHIIGMSAWRCFPGFNGDKTGPIGMHIDQIFVPMDEELLVTGRVHLPVFIATMHYYLVDITEDLCPTWMIPGSHKSGRGPGKKAAPTGHGGTLGGEETAWNGVEAQPVLCKAGDGMLFRSEVWHAGSANRTDRVRYLLQVHYAQRGVAQRFPPYIKFRHNPVVMEAASERQQRMMGKHRISAYG
ncbi:MAG: dioxygenase [Phycisphaera sp.]|nr:dioxygenase [Phycisphaera sp.]